MSVCTEIRAKYITNIWEQNAESRGFNVVGSYFY